MGKGTYPLYHSKWPLFGPAYYSGADNRMPPAVPLAGVSLQFSGTHSTPTFQAIGEKQTSTLQKSALLSRQIYTILAGNTASLISISLHNSGR